MAGWGGGGKDDAHQIRHPRVESDLARLSRTFIGRCQSPEFLLDVSSMVQGPFAAIVLQRVKVSVDQDFGFRGPCMIEKVTERLSGGERQMSGCWQGL
jgi:hypothetical protein